MNSIHINSSIGEYRIVDFLGAGGMGEVYRAVHSKIDRVVAIKVLTQTGQDSDFFNRFLNEARIQGRLHHQNIATLYDFVENQGRPCIIMEYVDGETLAEKIEHCGALPVAEALGFFQPVVEAIGYIHRHNVIHRDVKSNNVKIDSSGQVKLLDFGIARAQSTPKITATGSVIGTMQYLSPEQLNGAPANPRTDIWALGVLFYEMIVGRVPFEGTNALHLCEKIGKVAYVPPTQLNPSVPHGAESLIAHCLKKNPAERYQSAEEMLHDILILRGSHEKFGLKPNQKAEAGKWLSWARRNWGLVGAAAAFLLLIFVIIFALTMNSQKPDVTGGKGPSIERSPSANPKGKVSAEAHPVLIDVYEGHADVYRKNEWLGKTPLRLPTRLGEEVDLILKQQGFEDKHVRFTPTITQTTHTFPMKEK
jgi:serine/threonine protein kinase